MKTPLEFTHFGMFTNEQCEEAIGYCILLRKAEKDHTGYKLEDRSND